MAKNSCCSQSGCSCLIQAGAGIVVSGSGQPIDPYVVTSDFPDFATSFTVQDSATVNLSLTGSGNPSDPFLLKGDAAVALTQLTDVIDSGGPTLGDVPIWKGDHFEFDSPPIAPAGAVNATDGISGIGSIGDPLIVEVSGVWGTAPLDTYGADSTVGAAIYLDSAGELRAQPQTAAWADIVGKPSVFPPTPSTTWPSSQITNQDQMDVGKVGGHRIYAAATSSPLPTTPTPSNLDLFFFPKGA